MYTSYVAGDSREPKHWSGRFRALRDAMRLRSAPNFALALLLAALGLVMFATNPWFTFIDDECMHLFVATQPLPSLISQFLGAVDWPHLHPPLNDLLLHGWLVLTGGAMKLLRVPGIAFYLAGLWLLARTARRMAGPEAFWALVWLGVLWPLGFHFGRLASWYGFAFFLVALLTRNYLDYLEAATFRRWSALFLTGVALIYTNYVGWAFIGCLAIDFAWGHRGEAKPDSRPLLVMLAGWAVAFLPAVFPLLFALRKPADAHFPLLSGIVHAAFCFYALFVSESVAPWVWGLSILAAAGIVLIVYLILFRAPQPARKWFFYFVLLFALMSLAGVITPKRLILIAPWWLLALSLAVAAIKRKPYRGVLIAALAVVWAVGWIGILSRRYYAAPRFIEPWGEVAAELSGELQRGALVVAAHPSLYLYLTYARQMSLMEHAGEIPGLYDPSDWEPRPGLVATRMLLVKGGSTGAAERVEQWLERRCHLESLRARMPDPGYGFKQTLFPGYHQPRNRIEIREYRCTPQVRP
jgi:hypothetical protein